MTDMTSHLIGIVSQLRGLLAQLEGHELIAACAFIDHAICAVDAKLECDLFNRHRSPLPPDDAFATLDEMIDRLFSGANFAPAGWNK